VKQEGNRKPDGFGERGSKPSKAVLPPNATNRSLYLNLRTGLNKAENRSSSLIFAHTFQRKSASISGSNFALPRIGSLTL
jgi:hypothetical protein